MVKMVDHNAKIEPGGLIPNITRSAVYIKVSQKNDIRQNI